MHNKFNFLTEQREQLIREFVALREHLRNEMLKTKEYNRRATRIIDDSYALLKKNENLFLLLE